MNPVFLSAPPPGRAHPDPLGPTQLLVGLSRFELLTPRLSSVCSNQLSYRPSSFYQARYSPLYHNLSKNRTLSDSLKTR